MLLRTKGLHESAIISHRNAAVFCRLRSQKSFLPFVTRVSKKQMKSQYTSLPSSQPIAAAVCVCVREGESECMHVCVGGDSVWYEIIFS